MEALSLGLSPLDDKESEQMITLVSQLDGNDLIDNSTPLVHHVLEPPSVTPFNKRPSTIPEKFYENSHCLICNSKFGVSGRGSIQLFSAEVKTTARHLELSIILSNIVQRELDESNTHSSRICKKCFKYLDDIDSVEGQLNSMKQEVNNKFFKTLNIVEREKNGLLPLYKEITAHESPPLIEEDKEFKITSRVRPRKTKRGRGRGRPQSCVKLEVKEESDENFSCFEFIDTNNEGENLEAMVEGGRFPPPINGGMLNEETGEEVRIDLEDVIEVDGLDLNNEESTIQIGGMLLPTIRREVISKEMMSQASGDGFAAAESKTEKYKCRFCQVKMFSFSDIHNHLVQFHSERLFECEVCEERLSSQSLLLEHLEQHLLSGEKPYTCRLCPRRYALPRQLKEHLQHHLSKTIPCYQCPKRFKSEAALQEHMNTHTGYRPYPCDQCHKRFTSKHVLKIHMRTHGARSRPHKCKVCEKSFLTPHHLNDHMLIHQKRKDFICETCGKGFSTQRSLDLHSITHSGIKNFHCRICLKPFARKGEVEDHERIHTGEKPFQCEICGSTFSQRSNLQSHKRATHYEEKKYQCAECNKAFKRRRLLVYHVMSVHTGERPHKCSFCNSAFVYPEHYKKHLRIHTGEKPFKCEICGKAFNSRDNKNSHKFIHSEKKQYECVLCGVGFMRKPQMISHIQGHNPCDNIESYIKVNSSSVVDAELIDSRSGPGDGIAVKIDEEQQQPVEGGNIEHMTLVRPVNDNGTVDVISRQIQISDADDVQRYIIHKQGEKSDDTVGHFLASLQGQVVEVRAEDLERYTELTADQISQMAQVAAQVVATQNNGTNSAAQLSSESSPSADFRLFQIQIDDEDKDQTDCQQAETVITAESPLPPSNTDQSKDVGHILIGRSSDDAIKKMSPQLNAGRRPLRNWHRCNDNFVEES